MIQTVAVGGDEREPARRLGAALYEYFTRNPRDPMGFGPGIPVRVAIAEQHVDPAAADYVLVLPVLGARLFNDDARREEAGDLLSRWQQGVGAGRVIPVYTSPKWRHETGRFRGLGLGTPIELDADQEPTLPMIIEVVAAACQLLSDPNERGRLLVSHAPDEAGEILDVAQAFESAALGIASVRSLFEVNRLGSASDAPRAVAERRGDVFVAIRTDSYASRAWCQAQLLSAKRAGCPSLTIEVLQQGEPRSYPYAGNGPTWVWRREGGLQAVLRALVESVRWRHFEREAQRTTCDLPERVVLSRAPELLDLAQGPLSQRRASIVLHPDPELSWAEREVLRSVRPRLRLVTPSTLYRAVAARHASQSASGRAKALPTAPLRGHTIVMSLSEGVDDDAHHRGFTPNHLRDVAVHLARSLISAGAGIAYGGDFRTGGFDALLAQLVAAYNDAGTDRARYLRRYTSAAEPSVTNPTELPLTECSMRELPAWASPARLPAPTGAISAGRRALHRSDMRQVMTRDCLARILIGGQTQPATEAAGGYQGAFPGVVEEAWWSLKFGSPLYVVGGFGGAAALVAHLIQSDAETPPLLRAETFADAPEYAGFRERARAYREDPLRSRVEAPESMSTLADQLRRWAAERLHSDGSALDWNGLTRAENLELLGCTDLVRIAQLVMKGLTSCVERHTAGRLQVELIHGSITRAERADVIAVAAFRDLPLTGAGSALDSLLAHRVRTAAQAHQWLSEIPSTEVDADWLALVDLGMFAERTASELPAVIEEGCKKLAALANRHGFGRVALSSFAAHPVRDVDETARAMLAGLQGLRGKVVQWFEPDRKRFERLQELLNANGDVELTCRQSPEPEPLSVEQEPNRSRTRRPDLIAVVRRANEEEWLTTLLPPSGPAATYEYRASLPMDLLARVERLGADANPTQEMVQKIGEELGKHLFGASGGRLLSEYRDCRLVIQHDSEGAAIPFETLTIGGCHPGLSGGILRRPVLADPRLSDSTPRPPRTGCLRLALLVDPSGGTPGAALEAAVLRQILDASQDIEVIAVTAGEQATKAIVLQLLRDPDIDVLHYIGHAFYRGAGEHDSGLVCASGDELTLADLTGQAIGPRVVFFNACQSARTRHVVEPEPSRSFAEFFLRNRVEAYLGTFWNVNGISAARFGACVYEECARGATLDEAVRRARGQLKEAGLADWANYILYGGGDVRLKA